MYCFQTFFIFTCAYQKTAKWGAICVFRQKCSTGTSLQQKSTKTQKYIRNVFFSTFFHFYACTSKNGEMACNFRFSPKMFHRDVPSAKVKKKNSSKIRNNFFTYIFNLTSIRPQTAKRHTYHACANFFATGTILGRPCQKVLQIFDFGLSRNVPHVRALILVPVAPPNSLGRPNGSHIIQWG